MTLRKLWKEKDLIEKKYHKAKKLETKIKYQKLSKEISKKIEKKLEVKVGNEILFL